MDTVKSDSIYANVFVEVQNGQGGDKQWGALRCPQWFDLLLKIQIAKGKKHQNESLDTSSCPYFLPVDCDLCIMCVVR